MENKKQKTEKWFQQEKSNGKQPEKPKTWKPQKSQKDFLSEKTKKQTIEGTKKFKICISQASVLLFVGKSCKIAFFQIFEFIQELLKSAKLSKAKDVHPSSCALQSPHLTEA
jgi:hypothetical protein